MSVCAKKVYGCSEVFKGRGQGGVERLIFISLVYWYGTKKSQQKVRILLSETRLAEFLTEVF